MALKHPARNAFTLVELLAAIAVIAVLVGLSIMAYQGFIARADAVTCGNNMHQLHTALSSYLQDNDHIWPQEPAGLQNSSDDDAYEDWWIATLMPYGATEKVWRCPTIYRTVTAKSKSKRPKIHYTPTMFDARPNTAFRWETQPWLIEIGNMHGAGALICFPDGSIKTMNDVMGYTRTR